MIIMTTQYVSASYQEIIDLHTETDRVSVIGIHTPVTRTPYDMLHGFFQMYQKYHYDGCSMTMVPAARLPADPSQVSYEAGEPPIDPRDMLNPILWHGAHGESLGAVLNQFYSGRGTSPDITRNLASGLDYSQPSTSQIGNKAIYESLYYRALTDNTWLKAHPQRGFRKKGLHPLVYSLSTDRQYVPGSYGSLTPGLPPNFYNPQDPSDNKGVTSSTNVIGSGTLGTLQGTGTQNLSAQGSQGLQYTTSSSGSVTTPSVSYDNQFFTSRLHGLGWLDTRVRTMSSSFSSSGLTGDEATDSALLSNHYSAVESMQRVNYLPRLFMGVCLLPPAYKTEQYFRVILNHRFSFKKFRGMSMNGDYVDSFGPGVVPNYYNFN